MLVYNFNLKNFTIEYKYLFKFVLKIEKGLDICFEDILDQGPILLQQNRTLEIFSSRTKECNLTGRSRG